MHASLGVVDQHLQIAVALVDSHLQGPFTVSIGNLVISLCHNGSWISILCHAFAPFAPKFIAVEAW
jgi:hypothetical protein